MGSSSEFDQAKREVPALAVKIVCQVRADSVWVGMFASEDKAIAETTVWTKSFKRPGDKSPSVSAERAMTLALKAIENGQLTRLADPEEDVW